jgi:hypothetical protein
LSYPLALHELFELLPELSAPVTNWDTLEVPLVEYA